MLMDKDDEIFRLEELQCGKLIENLKYESMRSKWLIEMDAEIAQLGRDKETEIDIGIKMHNWYKEQL